MHIAFTILLLLLALAIYFAIAQQRVKRRRITPISNDAKLAQHVELLKHIQSAQTAFINSPDTRTSFDAVLTGLIQLTKSEYGFIGEVLYTKEKKPFLRSYAISDIAWNEETKRYYDANYQNGMEFFNLDTLFGQVLTTGKTIIANDAPNDARGGGVPHGHPPLNSFLGLPIHHQNELIGMAGIANRPGGYDQSVIDMLAPYIATCANLISAFRANHQRKTAMQQLDQSNARHTAVLDNVVDGIITIDTSGIILSANPATEKMFGYSRPELIGNNVNMLMPDPYKTQHDLYIRNFLQTSVAKIIGIGREVQGQRKDGSIFPMDLAVSEVRVGDEHIFTGIVRDITDRKRIEKLHNEFVATVSHELRTPLTSIRGTVGLLLGGIAGDLPDEAKSLLQITSNNTERLLLLINDILDVQKIESGQLTFRLGNVDVMELVRQAVRDNANYATQHQVNFKIVIEHENLFVLGDHDRLMQVLANLLSNAAKFSPPKSDVEIRVTLENLMVRVSVTDHGPGIPLEFQPSLFGKFKQLDSTDRRKTGGTGLGLNISKSIIEKHGGRIGFTSKPGNGSTFYFELAQLSSIHRLREKNKSDESSVSKEGYDFLVVEDDPDVCQMILALLQSQGYRCISATTIAEAKNAVQQHNIRAISVDLLLPDGNGMEFINWLRANENTKTTPIVVVSVHASESKHEINGGAVGIIGWINKPLDIAQFTSLITANVKPNRQLRVLHVEDDSDLRLVVSRYIGETAQIDAAESIASAKEKLLVQSYDIVLLDLLLTDGSGIEILETIQRMNPQPKVILLSGHEIDSSYAELVQTVINKSNMNQDSLLSSIRNLAAV